MRILRLTNSDDLNEAIPSALRAQTVAAKIIEARVGEPVETIVRVIWPDPELPGIVDSWLDRYQPDCVFMRAASYWVTYESVPLRLRRRGYPGTGWLARAGGAAGANVRLASSAPFRVGRRLAVRVVGGDTYFTPEEAAATVAATLRRIVVRESVVPVLRGPFQSHDASATRGGHARALARNKTFESLLTGICDDLHVPYVPVMYLDDGHTKLGDDVHSTARTHHMIAEAEGAAIADAWMAVHSPNQ